MPTLWNEFANLIENFKGHVEIKDGATWYKYDEILSWSVLTRADVEKHYSTNGVKKVTSIGDSSTYELRIKRTAELYDTADPPSQVRTMSPDLHIIYGTPRSIPIITLRGVSESNASSNEFIVDEFTATVESIDELRIESTGAEEVVVSGEILTHTINDRRAAAP